MSEMEKRIAGIVGAARREGQRIGTGGVTPEQAVSVEDYARRILAILGEGQEPVGYCVVSPSGAIESCHVYTLEEAEMIADELGGGSVVHPVGPVVEGERVEGWAKYDGFEVRFRCEDPDNHYLIDGPCTLILHPTDTEGDR